MTQLKEIETTLNVCKDLFEDIFVSDISQIQITIDRIDNSIKIVKNVNKKLNSVLEDNKVLSKACNKMIKEVTKNCKRNEAIEIIKKKRVNVFWLMECISCYTNALEKYNEDVLDKEDCLTEEEFDLLRGVLLCQ